jgi:hypothetical protein
MSNCIRALLVVTSSLLQNPYSSNHKFLGILYVVKLTWCSSCLCRLYPGCVTFILWSQLVGWGLRRVFGGCVILFQAFRYFVCPTLLLCRHVLAVGVTQRKESGWVCQDVTSIYLLSAMETVAWLCIFNLFAWMHNPFFQKKCWVKR